MEVKQSIHYFGCHTYHDSAELAPFITLKQFRLNLGCAEPSTVFFSGELLQMLTELILLAKFSAMDLVWIWMFLRHYSEEPPVLLG